jgi:hypothetical protein
MLPHLHRPRRDRRLATTYRSRSLGCVLAWRSHRAVGIFQTLGVLSLKESLVRYAYSRGALTMASALVALLAVAGCRSTGAAPPAGQRSEAFVRVENRSMLDMTVYVVRGGERRRLGMVNALSTQTLQIPGVLVDGAGVLRFLADPIGASRTPVSEEIVVRHGDVVQLIIPPQ